MGNNERRPGKEGERSSKGTPQLYLTFENLKKLKDNNLWVEKEVVNERC